MSISACLPSMYMYVHVCMNCAVNDLICNQRENHTGGDGSCVAMVGAEISNLVFGAEKCSSLLKSVLK